VELYPIYQVIRTEDHYTKLCAKHNRIEEAKLLLHYNADRDQYDQYGRKLP